MTDRELLEKAAEAAGYKGQWNSDWYSMTRGRTKWDPLQDDGDALRLAVKLGLWEAVRDGYQHVDSDGGLYAATRRAIVRAAAAQSPHA